MDSTTTVIPTVDSAPQSPASSGHASDYFADWQAGREVPDGVGIELLGEGGPGESTPRPSSPTPSNASSGGSGSSGSSVVDKMNERLDRLNNSPASSGGSSTPKPGSPRKLDSEAGGTPSSISSIVKSISGTLVP